MVFRGEGVDGGLEGRLDFGLAVDNGAVVLFFVVFGRGAGCRELGVALIELSLQISASVLGAGEGSSR